MNILLVLHGMRPEFTGGCEIHTERLARALVREGHTCEILAGTRDRRAEAVLTTSDLDGLTIHRIHRPDRFLDEWWEGYSPFAEGLLHDFLGRKAFDLVHVHHWKRLTTNIVRISASRGIPSVVTLHDLWSTCPREDRLLDGEICEEPAGSPKCPSCARRAWWRSEEEAAEMLALNTGMLRHELDLAGAVLTPSRSHRDFVAARLERRPDSIVVLPLDMRPASGERLEDGPADSRERFPEGPLQIAYWGHLVDFKGPHVVVDALQRAQRADRMHLHLFGTSPSAAYERLLRGRSRGLPVTFHGSFGFEDLARTDLDVAVLPSLCRESYSLVLDEAMELCIPVLVSDRGALPERIGEAGFPFRPNDPEDLARRLDALVEEPEELERARASIPPPSHGFERHVRRLMRIYEEAARRRPPVPTIAPYRQLLAQRGRALEARQAHLETLRETADRAENMEANLERYRSVNQELDQQRRDQAKVIRDLQADLNGHTDLLQIREKEIRELRESLEVTRADLEEHRSVLANSREESEALRRVVETLTADLEGHRAVVRELRDERERVRSHIEALEKKTRAQDERLEQSLSEARSERESLESENASLRGRAEEAQQQRARVEEELAKARARLHEIESEIAAVRRSLPYRVYRLLHRRSGRPAGRRLDP